METVESVLAANVADLRARRGLTTRALSARLAELGHPILASGISKIENRTRRVDVGDLVALAVALEVSPVRLLLPGGWVDEVRVTGERTATWEAAWRWATGEVPLTDQPLELSDPRVKTFIDESRPYEGRPWIHEAARGLTAREPAPFTAQIRNDGAGNITTRFSYGDEPDAS